MYKIVNGLLPDIMSESCIVNNEEHDNFTRQSHLLHTKKLNNHISIQSFTTIGLDTLAYYNDLIFTAILCYHFLPRVFVVFIMYGSVFVGIFIHIYGCKYVYNINFIYAYYTLCMSKSWG